MLHVPHGYNLQWTFEKVDQLKCLWAQSVPAREIAAQLGVTRMAVIGKARRLNLEDRGMGPPWTAEDDETIARMWKAGESADAIRMAVKRRIKGKPPERPAIWQRISRLGLARRKPVMPERVKSGPRIRKTRVYVESVADQDIPLEQRKSLLELEHNHCRWPVGDPQEPTFFFCGAVKSDEGPYCPHHSYRAHNVTRETMRPGPSKVNQAFQVY